MSFDSLFFLFCFLPFLLILYYALPSRGKPYILILFSFLFYSLNSLDFLLFFAFSVGINVLLGWLISQSHSPVLSKFFLFCGIFFDLSALIYYKYADFALSNFAHLLGAEYQSRNFLVPLGLSFFTFKAISYLVDTLHGKAGAYDPIRSVLYLSFFGQITSGPIARYQSFVPLQNSLAQGFSQGCVRFMTGLGKKVLLADVLCHIVNEVFNTASPATSLAWLGSVCYSLQLYYDFSGYSDMAIGLCQMLGYTCPENFDYPYCTRSLGEFWRRWHITLGQWFRDYVYIPLGGSRVALPRLYVNLFAVWLLTGLWHGANWTYILWGLGYFILLSLEKTFNLPQKLANPLAQNIYRIFVLLVINLQWVIFRSANLSQALSMLSAMFFIQGDSASNARTLFLLKDYGVFIGAAVLFAVPLVRYLEDIFRRRKVSHFFFAAVYVAGVTIIFLGAIAFIANGQNNPFLYGNF